MSGLKVNNCLFEGQQRLDRSVVIVAVLCLDPTFYFIFIEAYITKVLVDELMGLLLNDTNNIFFLVTIIKLSNDLIDSVLVLQLEVAYSVTYSIQHTVHSSGFQAEHLF